jgi:hypothetical protein
MDAAAVQCICSPRAKLNDFSCHAAHQANKTTWVTVW